MKRIFTFLVLTTAFVSGSFGQMVVETTVNNSGPININGQLILKAQSKKVAGTDSISSKFINATGGVVEAKGLTIESASYGWTEYGGLGTNANNLKGAQAQLDINDGTVTVFGDSVRIVKNFKVSDYYAFSLPFDVPIAKIWNRAGAILGNIGNTNISNGYWFYKYDSKQRASTNQSSGDNWKIMTSPDTLFAGLGYMVWIDKPGEYTFPAHHSTVTSLKKDTVHTSPLAYYYFQKANGGGDSTSLWSRGLVAVGAKQYVNFDLSPANIDTAAVGTTILYVMESGVWKSKTSGIIAPHTGLMAQISRAGKLIFKPSGRTSAGAADFRASAAGDGSTAVVIQLYAKDQSDKNDYVTVETRPGANPVWGTGEDGMKQMMPDRASVYALIGADYADRDVLPAFAGKDAVKLGVNIQEEGEYTFRTSDFKGYEGTGKNVYLIDNENKTTNLISPVDATYSFHAKAGTNDSRFELRVTGSTTDLPAVYSKVYVYAADQGVYVKNLTVGDNVAIYNVAGQLVESQAVASSDVFYKLPAAGVYIVKVTGAEPLITKVINK